MIYIIYIYIFDPKQNEFVCIVGHGSESFSAFLNVVILQKNKAAVITAAVITLKNTQRLQNKSYILTFFFEIFL